MPVNRSSPSSRSQPKRNLLGATWDILNKPFTLFVLGSIVLGLVVFTFTSFQDCRENLDDDQTRLSRLYMEYGERVTKLADLKTLDLSDNEVITRAREILDPNTSYIFLEFKGKNFHDLAATAEDIKKEVGGR